MAAKKKPARKRAAKKTDANAKTQPAAEAESPAAESPAASVDRKDQLHFPVVAIGASAGGLDAFKKFFSHMPADGGIAFVLIPHLDPTHRSLMVELLAMQTQMPVSEAEDGISIQANCVYIIPPNKYLAIRKGRLQLTAPTERRGLTTAIDFCLRSLAADQHERAIGIILSGTGSHGTLGLKEIKLAGGMVMVQEPESADYDQMPRNAIATGLVDYVLPPEQMPDALVKYARHPYVNGGSPQSPAEDTEPQQLNRILAVLKTRTKYDFRCYRKKMLLRRVQRRMGLCQIQEMADYLEYLRENLAEATALYKDLLIGVTAFFREPEAFQVLVQRVLPELVERADGDTPVRVWIPGCATGEEAYSIAMLLVEQFTEAQKPPHIQIFASDIDEDSLETARHGFYADSIVADLSPERLQRFFVKTDENHYQVSKQLRESVVFAPQNLISDAPFSKLDLVTCRNLLIYLEPDVQAKVIRLFHFALAEDGYLLLGPSESIGGQVDMFETLSTKWRVYRRIGPVRRDLVEIPIFAGNERRVATPRNQAAPAPAIGFKELTQKLVLDDYAPATALINRKYEILSVLGPLVHYLEFPPGEITKDVLAMARPGLRTKLRAAVHQAIRDGETVIDRDARVRRDGAYVPCTITVKPVAEPKDAESLLLVTFVDRDTVGRIANPSDPTDGLAIRPTEDEESKIVQQLEYELKASREDLQSTVEEMESSNEELKASNEEVMSMNEELQSSNEELETSKEELQSLNEELSTVNNQLQDKVDALDKSNNDMTNLMASADIATIFLDTKLCIKWFTPPTEKLLNLMATDLGRPLRDFAPKFHDDTLLDDCRQVLEQLTSIEKELTTDDTRSYLRRILPYRTADNRIDGVVVTFVDITARTRADAEARRLATALHDSNDAVIAYSLDGSVIAWNPGARRMYGYSESQALKMNIRDIVPADQRDAALAIIGRVGDSGQSESFDAQRLTKDGRTLDVWMTVSNLVDEAGQVIAVTTERDITDRKQIEVELKTLNDSLEFRVDARTADLQQRTDELATSAESLRENQDRMSAILNAAADAMITIGEDGIMIAVNPATEKIFGYTADETIGQNVTILMPSPYHEEHDQYLANYKQTGQAKIIGIGREVAGRRKDGSVFPLDLAVSEHHDGTQWLFTGIVRDITERNALQRQVLEIATEEDRRIGQDLHDGIGQQLTALLLTANTLLQTLHEQSKGEQIVFATKLADGLKETLKQVRILSKGLVPVEVDSEGLMSALTDLAAQVSELEGIDCTFQCDEPVLVQNAEKATQLYRIAQEAVTNAVKHAQMRDIQIGLHATDEMIALTIEDNGIGLPPADERQDGIGLKIMQYRANLLGGQLSVLSPKQGGTLVACTVPRRRAEVGRRGVTNDD